MLETWHLEGGGGTINAAEPKGNGGVDRTASSWGLEQQAAVPLNRKNKSR